MILNGFCQLTKKNWFFLWTKCSFVSLYILLKHLCFNIVNPQQTTIERTTTMLTDQQCFKIVRFMVSVITFAISSGAVYVLGM